jgi:hypothetical protein
MAIFPNLVVRNMRRSIGYDCVFCLYLRKSISFLKVNFINITCMIPKPLESGMILLNPHYVLENRNEWVKANNSRCFASKSIAPLWLRRKIQFTTAIAGIYARNRFANA